MEGRDHEFVESVAPYFIEHHGLNYIFIFRPLRAARCDFFVLFLSRDLIILCFLSLHQYCLFNFTVPSGLVLRGIRNLFTIICDALNYVATE